LIYEFSCDINNSNLTLIQKYNVKDLDESLERLKICHNGRFLIFNKTNNKNERDFEFNPEILDKYIGAEYQPISINIVFQNKDYKYRTFSNLTLSQFKNELKNHFNFDYEVEINLKINSKSNYLDKIAFDKKNNTYLTLKQLKVYDKSILIISKSKNENSNMKNSNDNQSNENISRKEENTLKVSNIVCLEDDKENPQIIRTKLNKTFEYFIKKIIKKFGLTFDFNIRLRK